MKVFVTSLNRPGNVPTMEALAGDAELVWCVPIDQVMDYRQAGARDVLIGPRGKWEKVNAVLDEMDGWRVFTDDDCEGIWWLGQDGTRHATLGEVAKEFVRVGEERHAPLVLLPCIRNPFYLKRSVSKWSRTVDWFFAVSPDNECRYDLSMKAIGDTEFAARCFDRYGTIARVNYIMGDYRINDATTQFDPADRGPDAEVILRRYPHLFRRAKNPGTMGPLDLRRIPTVGAAGPRSHAAGSA